MDFVTRGSSSPCAVDVDWTNKVSFSILSKCFNPHSVILEVVGRSTVGERSLVGLVSAELSQVVTWLTGTGIVICTEVLVVPFVARKLSLRTSTWVRIWEVGCEIRVTQRATSEIGVLTTSSTVEHDHTERTFHAVVKFTRSRTLHVDIHVNATVDSSWKFGF